MALMARVVTGTVAAALVVAGGYVWADAHDFVPGVLTIAPEPSPPAPFPTAPGAVAGPPPQPTLADLDPAAPLPLAENIRKLVGDVAADPALGPSVGVVVVDLLTGETLASATPEVARIPASIQKTFTAAAALSALDPHRVLSTTVTQSTPGALTLVGAGDMMLAAGAGNPDAVSGRAGLDDLAAQVAESLSLTGITTVSLALDDTIFSGSAMGGWDADIPSLGFAAPVSAVAVDTGRLAEGEYAPRSADPGLDATKAFARALAAHGITVEGDVTRAASAPDAQVLASVDSATVGELVEYFLHTSDNSITEVVGRLVAIEGGLPGSVDGATKAVLTELGRLGIDTTGIVLVDCSGLSDGSSAPATAFAATLTLMADPAHPALRAGLVDLPIAGLDGTLSDRFLGTDAVGLVRAKTGSLPSVTSLAGSVMTADARQLLFVVMADQVPGPGQWASRQAVDAFVSKVAACGCS